MAARTKSRVTPEYKTKSSVRKLPTYKASLRQRGEVTVWFDKEAIDALNGPLSGPPRGQKRYSDLAITTTRPRRTVFHLALRQAEGFVSSLIRPMDPRLGTSIHTRLSRRGATVRVPPPVQVGPIRLVIDSTGLKMVGDGERNVLRHHLANKHRFWRKPHLSVDADGFIMASALTESRIDDGSVGVAFIRGYKGIIQQFTSDGAYNTRAIYEAPAAAGGLGGTVVIPRRREAIISASNHDVLQQREAAVTRIAAVGRRRWRKEAGAHRQAGVENAMLPYKRVIGEALQARKMSTQSTEAKIGFSVLNRITTLGRPISVAVVR